MPRADWRAVTLVGISILAIASWVGGVVPGGGKDAAKGNDCLVVLDGLDPGTVTSTGGKQTVTCSDCDPTCDADGIATANGACTFRLTACTNAPDVAGCEPAASLSRVQATVKVAGRAGTVDLTGGRSLLEGSVCGPPTDVVVPLRGRKPGKATVLLSALVKRDRATGTPKRTDKDKLQLVCLSRPSNDACLVPSTTTAPPGTTTSTTSTATTSTSGTSTSATIPSATTTTASATTTASTATSTTLVTTTTTSTTLPGTLPPDPSDVAPPVDGTVASDFASAAAFIVTSGIQTEIGRA